MVRKLFISALVVMVCVGTLLARMPLDEPARRNDAGAYRILAEQTAPIHKSRFKAPRAVHLKTAELEQARRVAIG